jgi:hypothetical protein
MTWFNGTKQSIVSSVTIPAEMAQYLRRILITQSSTAKLYIDGF